MSRLFTTRRGRFVLAVLAAVFAIGAVLMPNDEEYTGTIFSPGDVTIECGGAFSTTIDVDFDNPDDAFIFNSTGSALDSVYWFDGESAREVCSESRELARSGGIGLAVIAALLLVSSFFGGRERQMEQVSVHLAARQPVRPPIAPRPQNPTIVVSTGLPRTSPRPDAVTNTSDSQTPGWKDDPSGRHQQRYWDGARWTEHVFGDGHTGVDPY